MDKIASEVRKIAERINEIENKRRDFAKFLRETRNETGIVLRVEPDSLENRKITGVDGGITKKSLHGFDCMLIRTGGVCFTYKNGRIGKVDYFPSRMPTPVPHILEALSDLEWAHAAAIERQKMEAETALKCMEKFRPDVLLMDGSIVPYYSDRPQKTSMFYVKFTEMINKYKELYEKSTETGTILAGVIEDSRGAAFCGLIKDIFLPQIKNRPLPATEILEKSRDTNLLFWLLERGERTSLFKYTETPKEHPILKDFPKHGENIYSFYLKTAEFDRPIRVDFLRNGETEERLASIILAISGHHAAYGMPAPLIEADNIAKLSDTEMNYFYSQIMGLAGNLPSTMRLRREQRPF